MSGNVLNPGVRRVTIKGSNGEQDLRGAAADRPAADAVPVGTVYWSLDTGAFEWSDGTVWAAVSP